MGRILIYGPSFTTVFKHIRNRKVCWSHGGLRSQFTGRISIYGPYSESYLTIQTFGRKLKFWNVERRQQFTVRKPLYGSYSILRPTGPKCKSATFAFSKLISSHPLLSKTSYTHTLRWSIHCTLTENFPRCHSDDYDNDVNSKDAYELLCICVYV